MIRLQLFQTRRPKVMVVSHERSGTHFLMNSIARCFGYVADPWVNYDGVSVATNFHSSAAVLEFFEQFRGHAIANIIKSHHPFEFFQSNFAMLVQEFHVVYVYRDPRDVMVSFWRFLRNIRWHEGPVVDTPKKFIRSAPEANMLRYQRHQEPSMIHRWRTHVDSWTLNVPEHLRQHVTFVRFRDLREQYENVIRSIGRALGNPTVIEKPTPDARAIQPGKGLVGSYKDHFDADDLALFRQIAGPTMDRLGFDHEATPAVKPNAPLRVEAPA